jgi:hypothetical protein
MRKLLFVALALLALAGGGFVTSTLTSQPAYACVGC